MRTLALLLCLAAATAALSKKGPHAGPVWAPSWSDAIAEGRALNLPVVVHRHGFY